MQRYFSDEAAAEPSLSEEQIRHILTVMRMRCKDRMEIVHRGQCYLCEITSAHPFAFEIVERKDESPELPVDLTLLYCLPKGDKLDLVVQKATEIGVSRIVLVQSSRCICRYRKEDIEKKLQRFRKIATEASEQSRRLKVPELSEVIDFSKIGAYRFDRAYIAYEGEKHRDFREDMKRIRPGQSVGILVGSEGGFSAEEVDAAYEAGYLPVTLGKRILRSETAALYALSVLSYMIEESAK